MNATLPPCMAAALAPFAPPQSVVRKQKYQQDQIGTQAYDDHRAWFFDECRAGFDCGPDEDEDDFEGAPV